MGESVECPLPDQRPPTVADRVVNTLMVDEHPGGCFGELRNAAGLLARLPGTTKLEQHQGGNPSSDPSRVVRSVSVIVIVML